MSNRSGHEAAVFVLATCIVVAGDSQVVAAFTNPSYSFKFASDEPNGSGGSSQVNSDAGTWGILGTRHWTNLTGANNATQMPLVYDQYGVYYPPHASHPMITWSSAGTWSSSGRGQNNNLANGENRDLMAGYLDSGGIGGPGISITVTGLSGAGNSVFDAGCDVVVYIQSDQNGQGGLYTLTDEFGSQTIEHVVTAPFDGTYIVDDPAPGSPLGSNFDEVFGRTFTLTATPTIGNPAGAAINAIEIVMDNQIPEPSSFALIAFGAMATAIAIWRRWIVSSPRG
jgi:PEP-CTERM motif-containing protein